MKKSECIFALLRDRIYSEEFKNKHKISEKAFIRNCILNFQFIVLFILNQIKKSNAAEIDSSNTFLENVKKFTKSALSKARLKLSPKAFIELNNLLTEEFYRNKSTVKHFFNFIVFAIDGSKLQLPESDELISKYGSSSNQNGHTGTMALFSQCVDVINGIVFHAVLSPFKTSEKDLAIQHINEYIIKRNTFKCLMDGIILFDRGYPGLLLISKLFYNNIHFLMRYNTFFIKEVKEFVASGKKDGIVKIGLKRLSKLDREEILKECPGFNLNQKMLLRVVIVAWL